MRKRFLLEIFLLLLVMVGCSDIDRTDKKSVIPNDTIPKNKIATSVSYPAKDSLFTYFVTYTADSSHTLTIETTLIYDSLFLEKEYFSGGNKIVLKQMLVFKEKGSVLSKAEIPISELGDFTINIGNKETKLPRYIFTNIYSQKRRNENVYMLGLFGLSNGSLEITAYYSLDGKLLCLNKCGRSVCDTIGNVKNIERQYNLSDTMSLQSAYIFPPPPFCPSDKK